MCMHGCMHACIGLYVGVCRRMREIQTYRERGCLSGTAGELCAVKRAVKSSGGAVTF